MKQQQSKRVCLNFHHEVLIRISNGNADDRELPVKIHKDSRYEIPAGVSAYGSEYRPWTSHIEQSRLWMIPGSLNFKSNFSSGQLIFLDLFAPTSSFQAAGLLDRLANIQQLPLGCEEGLLGGTVAYRAL